MTGTASNRASPGTPDPFNAFVERFPPTAPVAGPLAGKTFAAKDCLDLAGRAPGCGLAPSVVPSVPGVDAAIITLLREAGASLLGMTQMTALAYEPSGANAALGRPVNPLGSTFICGGSSSGSAVAVAAGDVAFAVGTDTAGSLRIPAQCCGISAWKPSAGLVATDGVMPLAPSLDTVGFLAPKAADFMALASIFVAPVDVSSPALRTLAIAADVAAKAPAAAGALAALAMAADLAGYGCRETAALPLLQACDAPVLTLLQGEAFRAHSARIAAGGLDPVLATRLAKGASVGDADLRAARATLAALQGDALDAAFGADEILVLPVMPCETPEVTSCEPGSPAFSPRILYALSAFTRFANGLGLPVVTLRAGTDAQGMPVSLQLVARRGRDASLIGIASALERVLDTR